MRRPRPCPLGDVVDWSNESYVRIYTRDTGDLLAVGWEGRSVLWELIRKSDQAGVLDHGGDLDIVAEMLRMPHDLVASGIERLAKRGVIALQPTAIVIRNKLAAHAATKTDKQRQKDSREKRLSLALAAGADPASARAAARPDRYGAGSPDVTTEGHDSGPAGHDGSHGVTPGHSGSLRAEQSRAKQSRAGQNKEPSPSGLVLADALREHLVADKPDHALADEAAWKQKRPAWGRQMSPIAAKRSEEGALQLLAWVFGEQDGRTEYRFRVDSPEALKKKFDRIESAMRAPLAVHKPNGHGRGMSAQDIWDWSERVREEEESR